MWLQSGSENYLCKQALPNWYTVTNSTVKITKINVVVDGKITILAVFENGSVIMKTCRYL